MPDTQSLAIGDAASPLLATMRGSVAPTSTNGTLTTDNLNHTTRWWLVRLIVNQFSAILLDKAASRSLRQSPIRSVSCASIISGMTVPSDWFAPPSSSMSAYGRFANVLVRVGSGGVHV
ncbi:hypothetical protein [Botrimarina hoheduenensis]|uniref:Uncharacterized protein n=1 Tax=Botrimarina hoheduenensis TaxID=2528000 RepID=A0A5C5WF69_9BACT|nr:hypothetical protein [Botrimarina hoheduenensis]TWT48713.1 hypothetical protein Pla111_04880 [Botrimarina hoheduenensis]